jgi:hypothetical protein
MEKTTARWLDAGGLGAEVDPEEETAAVGALERRSTISGARCQEEGAWSMSWWGHETGGAEVGELLITQIGCMPHAAAVRKSGGLLRCSFKFNCSVSSLLLLDISLCRMSVSSWCGACVCTCAASSYHHLHLHLHSCLIVTL